MQQQSNSNAPALSPGDARELTDRIRVGVEAVWELVKQAYQSRAWSTLGYDSWDDYCTREFGTSRIKLPREERQEVVSSMREIGMSYRAIGSAAGISHTEARRSVDSGVTNVPPSPQPVTGTDGKTYTPKSRPESEPSTPEWEEVGTIPHSRLGDVAPPRPAPGFNTGDLDELNNEVHTPEPEKPKRAPLTGQALSATVELGKVIKRWETIIGDDRFTRSKSHFQEIHLSDLKRAANSLNQITTAIES